MMRVILGDGFVHVMGPTTILLVELEKGQLPLIYPFLLHRYLMTEY